MNYSPCSNAVRKFNLVVTVYLTVDQLHRLGPNPSADPPSLELASRAGSHPNETMDIQFKELRCNKVSTH